MQHRFTELQDAGLGAATLTPLELASAPERDAVYAISEADVIYAEAG